MSFVWWSDHFALHTSSGAWLEADIQGGSTLFLNQNLLISHNILFALNTVFFALLWEFKVRRNHNGQIFDTVRFRVSRRIFHTHIFGLLFLKNMAFVNVDKHLLTFKPCWDFVQVFVEALFVMVWVYCIYDFVCKFCNKVLKFNNHVIYVNCGEREREREREKLPTYMTCYCICFQVDWY